MPADHRKGLQEPGEGQATGRRRAEHGAGEPGALLLLPVHTCMLYSRHCQYSTCHQCARSHTSTSTLARDRRPRDPGAAYAQMR